MVWERASALLSRYGIVFYNAYRTCPVQTFGRAGTNLGRAAGRDLLPLEVAFLFAVSLSGTWPSAPSRYKLKAFKYFHLNSRPDSGLGPLKCSAFRRVCLHLTESIYKVVLQKPIHAQILQLILSYYYYKE